MFNILKIYYSFLAKKRLIFAVFILLVILASALHSITPYFYKLFVDEMPSLNYQNLFNILIIYVLIRLAALIANMISYTVGDYIVIDAGAYSRTNVFKKVQDLDFAFHTSKSTGSLISIVKRGDGSFFNLFHEIHFRILNVLVQFIIMLLFLSTLNPLIGLSIAISVLAQVLTFKFTISYNMKTRSLFNDAEDDVSSVIVDNFVNFETVKLFAKETWERQRLADVFEIWKKRLWKYGFSFRFIDISVGGVMTAGIFITLYIALLQTISGQMSIGDFVLVTGFTASFYPQMFELVFAMRNIAKNFADIERYFGLLSEKILVKDPKKPTHFSKNKQLSEYRDHVKGEIIFKNVYFSYKGGQKNALHGVSLHIRQGQSVALVGRSGSGKTTMTKALMRFYDIQKGEITIDGVNIKNVSKQNLRSLMGVVPQEPILFNNSIAYNIKYGRPEASDKQMYAAAKMAHIHDFIISMPEKYKTNVGERGIKLSGGQKQRIAIARMILSNPDIIIFDEATSHLDSESEKLIQDAFWRASKNKTTLIIAHRLSTIMKADKIVVMNKGKIEEIGTHGELLNKKSSLYKHLWDLQTSAKG